MNKLLLLLSIFSGQLVFGQSITNQVADSVCICFSEKIAGVEVKNPKDSLNSCLGTFMAKNSNALFEEYKLDGFTVENIQFTQRKILARLEKKCKALKEKK